MKPIRTPSIFAQTRFGTSSSFFLSNPPQYLDPSSITHDPRSAQHLYELPLYELPLTEPRRVSGLFVQFGPRSSLLFCAHLAT